MYAEESVFQNTLDSRNKCISVLRYDLVLKDGVEVSRTLHRHVLAPGDDISNENADAVLMANMFWTPEVITAYKEQQNARHDP